MTEAENTTEAPPEEAPPEKTEQEIREELAARYREAVSDTLTDAENFAGQMLDGTLSVDQSHYYTESAEKSRRTRDAMRPADTGFAERIASLEARVARIEAGGEFGRSPGGKDDPEPPKPDDND